MPDFSGLTYALAGYGKNNPYAMRRKYAYSMLTQGMDSSPIVSPWQGVSRLAQALVGGYLANQANEDEQAAADKKSQGLAAAIAKMKTDPQGGLADLSALEPELGARYAAQMAMDEAKTKSKSEADAKTAGYLLSPGGVPNTAPQGGGVNDFNIGNVRPPGSNVGFQQPPTLADGIALTQSTLKSYPAHFNNGQPMTLVQIGQHWAPSNENDTAAWVRNVATIAGIDPNKPLDLNDPATMAAVTRGIHGAEKGQRALLPPQAYIPGAFASARPAPMPAPPAGLTPAGPPPAQMPAGPNMAPGSPPPVQMPQVAGGAMPPNAGGQGSSVPPVGPLPNAHPGAVPTPLPNAVPGEARAQPASDPGAIYEAAARRAQAAGDGTAALKYAQLALQARTQAAGRSPNHVDLGDSIGILDGNGNVVRRIPKNAAPGTGNLQHVDLGDSIAIIDPRTGNVVQRIPKGQAGGGGVYPGKDQRSQATNILLHGTQDPNFVNTPEYASAYAFLSQPHQAFDESRGVMVMLPPADLSWAPKPGFHQQPPQSQPAGNPLFSPVPPVTSQDFANGAPPPPNPGATSGPAVVAGGAQAGASASPSVAPVPGLPPKPLTADQSVSATYADRMRNSNAIVEKFTNEGRSLGAKMLEAAPFGVGNLAQTPEYQQLAQAERDFINALLRRESGAVISPEEFDNAKKQYFPQPGDSPEVLKQKAINRQIAVDGMIRNAGPGYKPSASVGSNTNDVPPPPDGARRIR